MFREVFEAGVSWRGQPRYNDLMTPQILTHPRVHFRNTTATQRELLFTSVAETGNVSKAAQQAHVGRGTHYYWRPRYAADGPAGLAQEGRRVPHHPRIPLISDELQAEAFTA
jgi:hypothetical protein